MDNRGLSMLITSLAQCKAMQNLTLRIFLTEPLQIAPMYYLSQCTGLVFFRFGPHYSLLFGFKGNNEWLRK